MQRREFIKTASAVAGAACLSSCTDMPSRASKTKQRVLVMAFDGLDAAIVSDLMRKGRLPNLSAVAREGGLKQLGTTTPPHTPVAFASVISGADPGKHGIFDFIHRDPNPRQADLAVRPYYSSADTVFPETRRVVPIGKWRVPLNSAETKLLRRGPTFWESLTRHGVDTSVYYLPSNFPPQQADGPGTLRSVSGMGTPDLLGGYGEFTLLASGGRDKSVDGGRFVRLSMNNHRTETFLIGPPNFLKKPDGTGALEPMTTPVRIVRDPKNHVAMIQLCGERVVLNQGEWSNWIAAEFRTGIPGGAAFELTGARVSVRGIVRILLKQVHPELVLYISPLNIDPVDPVQPISTPNRFAKELAERHGRFYTLGIPEDTKALSYGALSEDEFIEQVNLVVNEQVGQFESALGDFQSGCLFFYFGWTDLMQHMFWRDRDPEHPGRDPKQGDRFAHVVDEVYERIDQIVGQARKALTENDVLIAFSDHGFTTFRREFHLNTWLQRNGFMRRDFARSAGTDEGFADVDWSQTRAYGLGMNGLYINQAGRERHGVVKDRQSDSLLAELSERLCEVRDIDGARVIERVDITNKLYPNADSTLAPDLIVSYANGYRASWATVLGGTARSVVENNLDRWSGTHLIAPELVPGMLIANRPIRAKHPSVMDIAPTILSVFNAPRPAEMTGASVFENS